MVLDVDKEVISMNKAIGMKKESVIIEGDIIVPDIKPDILSTINTSSNIMICKKEVLNGKLKIEGSIDVYILYLADTDKSNIRGLNTTLTFSQIIDFDDAKDHMQLKQKASVKSIDCKVLNGRKVNVKASVEFEVQVYDKNEVEVIKEVDKINDIQCLKRNINVNSLVGEGKQKTTAKDTIMLDEGTNIAEILDVQVRIINKDIKLSYNKVLAKADACVKILYLTEDDDIKACSANIPVVGFVDIQDLNDDMICDMEYEIQNMIIDSKESNCIYLEIEVEISAKAYQNKEVGLIDDIYCPTLPITFNSRNFTTSQEVISKKQEFVIKQVMNIPELENCNIYDISAELAINNQNIINERLMLNGSARINIVYSDNSSKVNMKRIDIPYEFSTDLNGCRNNMNAYIGVDVEDIDFIIMPNTDIDINIKTTFNIQIYDDIRMNIIDEINLIDDQVIDSPSVAIYYVKKGDTLWKIAKKFNSTIENILKVNEMQNYEENLRIGTQLFIPRYVSNNNNILD